MGNKIKLIAISVIFFMNSLYGLEGVTYWTELFNDETSRQQTGYDKETIVDFDNDGNFYILIDDDTGSDINIVLKKYNSSREEVFSKILASGSSYHSYSLRIDKNNEFIYSSFYTPEGSYLAKYNLLGEEQWKIQRYDSPYIMKVDPNGNLLFSTGHNLYKYLSSGNIYFSLNNELVGEGIQDFDIDSEGNVYITGNYNDELPDFDLENPSSPGETYENDIYLIKYNSSGAFQWLKTLGSHGSDGVNSLTIDKNGDIYLVGESNSEDVTGTNSSYEQAFIVKYYSSGTKAWSKVLDYKYLTLTSVKTIDSSIYLSGYIDSDNLGANGYGDDDIILFKYNAQGEQLYTKILGGHDRDLHPVLHSVNNELLLSGKTNSNLDEELNPSENNNYRALFVSKLNTTYCEEGFKSVNNVCIEKTCQFDGYNCPVCDNGESLEYNIDKSGYCLSNSSPTISISSSALSAKISGNIHFYSNITDENSMIDSVSWNFGDNETSTLNNTEHSYSSAGTYTVKFTATLNTNETIVKALNIIVVDEASQSSYDLGYDFGKQFIQDNLSEFNLTTISKMNETILEVNSSAIQMGQSSVINNPSAFDLFTPSDINETRSNTISQCLNDPSLCGIENLNNITASTIDSLPSNWTLIGTSSAISDLSIFNNTKIVWIYDENRWFAYSPIEAMATAINEAGISTISTISENSGIWINK